MDIKESQKKSVDQLDKSLTKEAIEELSEIEESIDPKELVENKFYTGGLSPILSNYIPEGLVLTQQELVSVQQGMRRLSTGLRAAIPITCYGEKCPFTAQCPFAKIGKMPFGKSCHLPGALIKTAQHGDIAIEDLDVKKHTVISYNRRRNTVVGGHKDSKGTRKGLAFTKQKRNYKGSIIQLETESKKKQSLTQDHISIARFNEKALNKFCIYIMRKGSCYRIGKSQILNKTEKGDEVKYYMPIMGRLRTEKADALWVLGVYETNTEALLAEEYFSCMFQAPKSLFLAAEDEKRKHNGLYAWVSQEQLDAHHQTFLKPACYWGKKLEELGLSLHAPFIEKDNSEKTYNDIKVYAKRTMFIRSCNLIPSIMDVPIYTKNSRIVLGGKRTQPIKWEKIKEIKIKRYKGIVYSLEVDRYRAYFANDIGTHNCSVEAMLMDVYTKRYLDEFEVRSEDMSEVATMSMLAATHIMEMRAFMVLGKEAEADKGNPDGFIKNVVGFNNDDEPIIQMQEHPAFNQVERAWRWRKNLLESMVGTRREKYRRDAALKERASDSGSFDAADLKSKIDKLRVVDISED